MHSKPQIQVLRRFQPLARSLAVYNLNHFNGKCAIKRTLLDAIGWTGMYISILAVSAMNCWACFDPASNWSDRAYHLVVMLCLIQQLFIAIAMTKENGNISDALEQLQQTVNNREHSQFNFFLRMWLRRKFNMVFMIFPSFPSTFSSDFLLYFFEFVKIRTNSYKFV